ncbi:MAG: ABC transporter permease [Flavobacteriales bacterium]|nr:ABC transporter permease [Flavobacteriales bacterium]
MLLRLAWRNVWRHPGRSGIIIGAVAIGLFASLFLMAFYQGMIEQRIDSVVRHETSHIQLHHPDYVADQDINFRIAGADCLVHELAQLPRVVGVAPRVAVPGMIQSPTGSAGLRINGVDPELEDRTTGLSAFVKEGEWFGPERRHGILISAKVARQLKVQLRGKVVLMAQGPSGEIASGAFRVIGIYGTLNGPRDDANAYITREDAAEMLDLGDEVHEIAILLDHSDAVDASVARLRTAYPQLLVRGWTELSPEMEILIGTFDQMMFIMLGIIFIALAFGLVNTMLMAVLERTREIGMLMAVGMGRARIFGMVVLETLLVVLAGVPVGGAFSAAAIGWGAAKGINLSAWGETATQFGYDPHVILALKPYHALVVLAMVVAISLLSAIYPAVKALKLNAAEAIRK